MEILNIAILDDSQSKITRIKTKFSQHNDKETSLYDERYAKYKLNLCQIDVEKSCNEIIAEILKNNFDAIIIDYDFTSFAKTSNNGIIIAKTIEEKFCEYPLFILTAYEERLFENEVFDVYQIYNYDNYINNDEVAKEFHIHIIEQILKSKKQIELWEAELKDLLTIPKNEITVEITSRILDLDSKIENSIDGISSLSTKLKEDLYSNKLDKLLQQANKLLQEE